MSDEKEKISQFYNEYQVINFSDQNELKSEKKALTKHWTRPFPQQSVRVFTIPQFDSEL